MCSTDIQKPEGIKITISLFYYCSESGISIVHQRLSKGLIPLCMSIATLVSIKSCAHRDTAREKGDTDFLTWFVSSSLASNAGIRDLQAYSAIGIQGSQSFVVLNPVQKSRLSFIRQFGDHRFSPPASLHPLEAQIFYPPDKCYGYQVILFHQQLINSKYVLMFLLLLVLFFKCWLQFVLELSLVRRRFPWAVPIWG